MVQSNFQRNISCPITQVQREFKGTKVIAAIKRLLPRDKDQTWKPDIRIKNIKYLKSYIQRFVNINITKYKFFKQPP